MLKLPVASNNERTMLKRIENILVFDNKRDYKLVTPCCNKQNTDGKFVNYKGYSLCYGYCHSCGVATHPPYTYRNEKGEEFIWNTISNKFEPVVLQDSTYIVTQNFNTEVKQSIVKSKYIDNQIVGRYSNYPKENKLLVYLRANYTSSKVDKAKSMYQIGTTKHLWTVFWMINRNGNVQKAKVALYSREGKRAEYFKVPYKNEDGYYSCIFGEHLLNNNTKPIILVESEKTAVVSSILLPHYTWLSYGGINGLTPNKMKALAGETVVIIPDMSDNAVKIMKAKAEVFKSLHIKAKIFDMRSGLTDEELKVQGWYNSDIEDVFRNI